MFDRLTANLAVRLVGACDHFRPHVIRRQSVDADVVYRRVPMASARLDPALGDERAERTEDRPLRQPRPRNEPRHAGAGVRAGFEVGERRERL